MDDFDAKATEERARLIALLHERARQGAARRYVGVVRKTVESDYNVDFPDLPGCIVAGKTMREARRLAAEALAFHLDGMAANGVPVLPPRSLEAIRNDPECQDANTLILVEAPAKSN